METSDAVWPTATEIAADVRTGRRTPRDIVDSYLDRIDRHDRDIGAFQVVAAELARRDADNLARRGDLNGLALAGVPVAVKDSVDVAGLPTRHGSGASSAEPRPSDDPLVSRLREAGAIVIGKTRLPEYGIWGFTESRAHGGTRNPIHPARNAGGSTGGGAAAVAAGFAPLALGSDGGGSLRIPPANCGVVGIKPSRGTVPLAGGIDDHWFGCTVMGPIAMTVADAALALDVLAGTARWRDPKPPRDRLRIAMSLRSPSPMGRPDGVARRSVARTADLARSAGHQVTRADPPYPLTLVNEWVRRWHAGVAMDVRRLGHRVGDLEPRTRTMVAKGEWLLRKGRPRPTDGQDWVRRVESWFDRYDVLISPVIARPAPRMGWATTAGYWLSYLNGAWSVPYTQAWNLAGVPALSLPVRAEAGRPGAVQIVAPAGRDETVLALAVELEGMQ